MEKMFLGIDIGGTKIAVCAGDEKLEIVEKTSFASGSNILPQKIIDEITARSRQLIEQCRQRGREVAAAGVSCGGPLNSRTGIIMSPPNLPLWDNIRLTDILSERLSIPVYLQNDANACAMAEWKYGSGKGTQSMVFLTFGTGMGAGLILNGRLYTGASDMAGEAGHIRLAESGPEGYGKSGSFEGFCSGSGIKRLAEIIIRKKWANGGQAAFCKTEGELARLTAKDVFTSAESSDETALEIVSVCAEKLGRGLAVFIDLLNPECIVIGSIYTRAENLLREKMLREIEKEALAISAKACRIKPAALNENLGDIAALTVAACGYAENNK